jgi:hypothetical protein
LLTYKRLHEMGYLGNQLWEIASTVGLAWQRGTNAAFPQWDYLPYFNVPAEWFVDEVPEGPGVTDLSDSYLQDLDNFRGFEERIRQYFKPRTPVLAELDARFPWFQDIPNPVALHVRRGDYLSWPEHYPVLDLDYYRRAVKEMRARHPDARIVVFSDDINWCRRVLPSEFVFVDGVPRAMSAAGRRRQGEPQDQYDLFLMARCVGHIIANSTYSWWGAFLAGDTPVCYPTTWYGPRLQHIEWRRMIPESWIGL